LNIQKNLPQNVNYSANLSAVIPTPFFSFANPHPSVFANITEAQYPQSLADMLSKFKIARKECAETESWIKLLYNTKVIDEATFKIYRNLCGRIQRMLTSSCITIEKKIDNK